jgi:uncharacterized protein with HEPN domain
MKDDKLYLGHINDAIATIEEYLGNINYGEFCENKMMADAVVRQLEIIGEAAAKLNKNFRNIHSEIPFRDIIDMRNVLIHDYAGVNTMIVWETCKIDLPPLKEYIRKLMGD